MSMTSTSGRVRAFLDPRPARWSTVVILAAVMAVADTFVLTSLTGAVGAIERTQGLFGSWLIESLILLPLFVLAELLILKWARKRYGMSLRGPRRILTASLLIALTGTVVGVAAVTASAGYDYYLQASQIDLSGPVHEHDAGLPGTPAGDAHAAAHANCDETCQEKQQTLQDDLRGVGFSGPILLGVNLLLVAWMLAAFGGELSAPRRRRAAAKAAAGGSIAQAVPAAAGQASAPQS
jgi:hypothetical protein